ncbi:MAG: 2-hydroxyacid dehydrogenase [Burkholderiales bacterium]|nr:2-hydroxyacid dehydrogenase [Burkholderiales bacterium]
MKPEILILTPIYAPALDELEREFTVHKLWTANDPDAFIKEVSGRVRAMVTTGPAGFSSRHLDALPKLEIIACFGSGRAAMDLPAAKARGVVVTITEQSIAPSVADLAFGLIISVMRRICEADRYVRAGKWPQALFGPGRELGGKTCGIIGLGEIGKGVARRAEAFGMAVCYHGPRPKPDVAYPYYADLEPMARQTDCLVVTCPETPATRNLVDARILDALGPEGFLINVARGAIVDEPALIAALREGRIAGAGLDVFRDEPHVPAELVALDNVVMVPHIGSSTREVRENRTANLLANLRAHFSGKPVLTPIA